MPRDTVHSYFIYVIFYFFILLQFCVFKDLNGEEDRVCYEVGLKSWLNGRLDADMHGSMKWPPKDADADVENMIRSEEPPQDTWEEFPVLIMRFYGKYYTTLLIMFDIIFISS